MLALVLAVSVKMFGVGWTPTDAGFVLNFETSDQFLLSVWIDVNGNGTEDAGEEFFVCDYPSYLGGYFSYTAENYLKLIPLAADATEPNKAAIWTIGDPLKHKDKVNGEASNFTLDGKCYTMWGYAGNSLYATEGYKIMGVLAGKSEKVDFCDVAFVVPSDNNATVCMDPENTLGRVDAKGKKFNGRMGYNSSLKRYYREVYMFAIPSRNQPISYTNAALITFNKTTTQQNWYKDGSIKCGPGKSAYSYADNTTSKPHHKTPRTIFRIYPLNKPFTSCDSYFFGWDVQDWVRYRTNTNNSAVTYTPYRKIYTLDHFHCMDHVDVPGVESDIYQTEGMHIPQSDSTYFYVGYNNTYISSDATVASSGSPVNFRSKFKNISLLRIRALKDESKAFVPSKNAYGSIAISATPGEENLDPTFEPAGYMLRTSSNQNVKMVPNADRTVWTTEQMWTITPAWAGLSIKATLYTGPEFDENDPGADIADWSKMVVGTSIKTTEGGSVLNQSGWARIYVDSPEANGRMEFVLADPDTYIRYDNNGHFGVQIPDQHPTASGSRTVTIQDARLLEGYEFAGWATSPNGPVVIFPSNATDKPLKVGDELDFDDLPAGLALTNGVLHLYAKATYKGSISVAVSFLKEDGKRYFLTHPGVAPRFARARHFDDWTNVWQGMADINNADPNYLSTYKLIGHEGVCEECEPGEYVLDPHREVVHGAKDSLTFYEFFSPSIEEYIGLYYTNPNTVISNNTWAGLFQSAKGWPTPAKPCVDSTRLFSTHYLYYVGSTITRAERPNSSLSNIKYIPASDQFDGVVAGDSTIFMLSGVGVVDEHYVILPDTTEEWTDSIVFDYHQNETTLRQVWSKLIGKQLLAQMKVGEDTIYFHPENNKTIVNANALQMSSNYRLSQSFEYIRDTRPDAAISEADVVTMDETENAFCCNVYSGASSPKNVMRGSKYIDIVDTLRVWLHPSGAGKIKEYYGRWKTNSPGLRVLKDGSRYRDILVITKTYHYSAEKIKWELTPVLSRYTFNPLAGNGQDLNFTLTKITYRQLLDKDDAPVRDEEIGRVTLTTSLEMLGDYCTFAKGGESPFEKGMAADQHIHISAKAKNDTPDNREDELVISRISVSGETITLATPVRVTLVQTTLTFDELIWSVVDEATGIRYFITARGNGTIEFREFTKRGDILYQKDSWTHLRIGAADNANTNTRYLTPWKFTYSDENATQLFMKTAYGVNMHLKITDGDPGTIGLNSSDSTAVTYEYVGVYTNDNNNTEELVRLQYGSGKWLKFEMTGSPATPRLTLTTSFAQATTFSWGYLEKEYNLQNNGTYPSADELVFAYNNGASKSVQTRYKAFTEYSILLGNTLTYLGRQEETSLANLRNESKEWKISAAITHILDERFDDTLDATDTVSALRISTNVSDLTTTVRPASAASPLNIRYPARTGPYVDIVDTLLVTLSSARTDYRFKYWSGVSSLSDATLKIPLVRKTYHTEIFDSIMCYVENDEHNFAFPSALREGHPEDSLHTFTLMTFRRLGTNILDVDNHVVAYTSTSVDTLTDKMDLSNSALAEIRLVDDYGKSPDWCEISAKGTDTITVRCKSSGIRTPRSATLYLAYVIDMDGAGAYRYVNFKLTVSQASRFQYANNQTLIHTPGASGDPLAADGRQQVHENKRILYYYNPVPYEDPDQDVELPVRERGFYGWWRWYQENEGAEDADIPDSEWITPPRNVGKFNYAYRIIGDTVKVLNPRKGEPEQPDSIEQLVTMGRYTVFHYMASEYGKKEDPPAKVPFVKPPRDEDTVTYVVDISNYYDNLPLSAKDVNQVDIAILDTMLNIVEPTLSIREVFELHPWTEMAAKLEDCKDTLDRPTRNLKYLEDHEVMAPIGNRLLLSTEQRYNYENLSKTGHSESLLGYYMRDDKYSTWTGDKDTLIWCGGWDADCEWYTYNPSSKTYSPCPYTVTPDDDFLSVPAKGSITAGQDADTVYFCLRARSKSTTVDDKGKETTDDGLYMFNICRYKIIYHDPHKFGPFEENGTGSAAKAIITNDEIEQNYEVLERLNFDYIKPGKDYHIYPHPLPWTDASYGYTYPVSPELPNNRYHDEKDFPGPGEYGIINRIPYSTYWRKFEQHGGAENGYMIYCDGMSSSGQVAALTLSTQLCEGQKMYFSGFVGNVSNQTGKANPNFTFSVQGWDNRSGQQKWVDIASYMTGDIKPSNNWYQIFFPINQEGTYSQFRIRIYNLASDFNGNDFVIDDMCVFATKPPLIAYQADTKCVTGDSNDSIAHVVLRIDYQGFVDTITYNKRDVYYTVEQKEGDAISFVKMEDHYFNETTHEGDASKPDTIFGYISMPGHTYVPATDDSIFTNLQQLVNKFDTTYAVWYEWNKDQKGAEPPLFRKGYLYEILDGATRPVMYVVHMAKMSADNTYTIRLATGEQGLMNSKCAMTSNLRVSNRMVLELNGEEQVSNDVEDMCANSTYELSMRVKGSLLLDSVAPIDINGSCVNDWLLYGDTAEATSVIRYGYTYSDIRTVVQDILRNTDVSNTNRFASSLASVNKYVLKKIQGVRTFVTPGHTSDHPYDILEHLVNSGFLTLYQPKITTTVAKGDSIQYVIFPIEGTGSRLLNDQNMEVCPAPIVIKLKPNKGGRVPMKVGGIHRDSTQLNLPVSVLVDARTANDEFKLHIDSILPTVAIHSISLLSTDDPDFYEGVHLLNLTPDKIHQYGTTTGYYTHGSDILLTPSSSNNYQMRQGYNYTFGILMQTLTGALEDGGCPVGQVSFTVSVVPDYLRWAPQSADNNKWNDPNNWLGVDDSNNPLPGNPRFAPLASTDVIIPNLMSYGLPYPEIPANISKADSVRKVNFLYNICDDIRFLPGAAIGQQQRLDCDVTVVDMIIPQQKWALRSAPVTGMISGDLFMSDADLNGETRPWSAGSFDAGGRNYKTGNASFWLSLYNSTTVSINAKTDNDIIRSESAEWSKVTNGMTLSLPPAQGWAVYARTASNSAADIRLPKSDDIYYYYGTYGEQLDNLYEDNLNALRASYAGESEAGVLAFKPGAEADHQDYTLTNAVASKSFVFGNPTMGYIDIWGFIADNAATLKDEIDYLDDDGYHTAVTKASAEDGVSLDTITNLQRYLPPMRAMVIKFKDDVAAASSLLLTLKTKRIVTHPSQKAARPSAPLRLSASARSKGIMTVTAVNPVSNRCVSRLLLGQGYNDDIQSGEDAVLTTLNIDNFHMTNTPTTPFNLYAMQGAYGLSVDLLGELVNVPISFCMSALPYAPTTYLWFTGVNAIDGPLVLYDALTDTERPIHDGICLEIETPEASHERRYYIRRRGYTPGTSTDDVPTDIAGSSVYAEGEQPVKIIRNGQVLVIRNGHVYTMVGQQIR